MTVRESLDASIAAHLAYREALTRNDSPAARAALVTALDTRVAAQADDSLFHDAAWAEYDGRYPHVALLGYYRAELVK